MCGCRCVVGLRAGDPEPAAAGTGAEGPGAALQAVDVEEPTAPEPVPAGPARITVRARVKGEPVAAQVALLAASGAEVASGGSGEPLSAPAGEYTLVVAIEDPSVLVDRPTQRGPITLVPGASADHPVEFPWASVQLRVRVNGRVDEGAKVDILRNGEVVATMKSDAAHVLVSPGRYGAKVRTRGAEVEVQQLMFPQGATRAVPVDVPM
ncbi:MAG: hypothetical protein OXT09_01775 [Myxococcales bacterium]|nr:hypothetical protein [Myxococcales bacterium]